jgi:hypothetical protein
VDVVKRRNPMPRAHGVETNTPRKSWRNMLCYSSCSAFVATSIDPDPRRDDLS